MSDKVLQISKHTTARKQASNQAIKQSSNQAIKQSSNQDVSHVNC
jgi:hypothetical protein